MDIRTELSAWAYKEFGQLHPDGEIAVFESTHRTVKRGIWLQVLTLEVKQPEAIPKNWVSEETRERWKKEIRQLIGKHMKLVINAVSGKELSHTSGTLIDEQNFKEEFVEEERKQINYQFKVEIKRYVKAVEEKNGK